MISKELQEEFDRFVEFGEMLDRRTRKYVVQYLASHIDAKAEQVPEINDQYFRYFRAALDDLFSGDELAYILKNNEHLSEQIVQDTLYWLRKTYKKIAEKTPYENELKELDNWSVYHLRHFIPKWQYMINRLDGRYRKEQLNLNFYRSRFKEIVQGRSYEQLEAKDIKSIDLLLTDLLSQWDALLQAKVLKYQLEKMEEHKEEYKQKLEAKAEKYNQLTKMIDPFAQYVGNYWDMSRELWQDDSFDVIQRYRDLLEDEDSIQRLVDILGKLREAETELEEETYEKTLINREWVSDPLMRSEIVGVHESDDLNNLISSEVSLLADKNTETMFLKKYMEKNLLTLQYEDQRLIESEDKVTEVNRRIKQKEKGPFIVCVDTSGSMEGEPEEIAKVLCFAICKLAAKENRKAYLINFSQNIQTLDLLNLANSLDEIAKFLRMSFRGGTDISLPLYEAVRQLQTHDYKDSDVLIISDFIMYKLDEKVIREIEHQQQNKGTQFHSIILSKYPNEKLIETLDNSYIYNPEKKGIIKQLYQDVKGINERLI